MITPIFKRLRFKLPKYPPSAINRSSILNVNLPCNEKEYMMSMTSSFSYAARVK